MKKIMKTALVMVAILLAIVLASGCTERSLIETSVNRLEEIKKRGYIEVVMEPYFAPYEFIDPSKSGSEKYVGSDVELAKYIAEKLGVELKIIPLEFTAVLGGIAEGKYDLAISALAYTPLRAEAMILSKGYYFSEDAPGYGLLIRKEDEDKIKDANDLSNKTVVAQSGSLQELFVNEQIPKYKEFKRVSATTDGILMVEQNKADSCVVAISMAQLYIDANTGSGLKIVDDFEFKVDKALSGTRIGITLGENELAEKINEIIDDVVDSGQYEQWYKEYAEYAKQLGL
ncbi:MAG: transporter substrate-binding domain-containing protein [Clostridiales bacterium]|nr:transporter substrate-binding domain-containing protein [Clostridiales bacterium]